MEKNMAENKKISIKCPKCLAIAMECDSNKTTIDVVCKECGHRFIYSNSIFKTPTSKAERITSSGKRFS